MEDKKAGNKDLIEFKLKIRERAIKEIIRSNRRATSFIQELHLENIKKEVKEVKLENPVKGYLPLNQHQKHHYHRKKKKKKKCRLCRSCNDFKRNYPTEMLLLWWPGTYQYKLLEI